MRRVIVLVVVAAVAAWTGAGCGSSGSDEPYAVEDLATGSAVSTEQLEGRPAVLMSWATWCRECDELLAGLQEFATSDAAEGVEVVAVNLDAADVEEEIQQKVDRHGLTVELWRDRRNEFKGAFGAIGVPTTVVLDPDGQVVGTFPGAVDHDGPEVRAALAEARSG